MNKIIQALLETKFPTLNIVNLLEVVGATPNPEVAVEILCGLYEEPKVEEFGKDINSEVNRVFLSYDKFNDKVTYSYNKRASKTIYALKSREVDPPFETKDIEGYYISEKAKTLKITEEEFKTLYEQVVLFGEVEKNSRTTEIMSSQWNN